MATLYGKDKVVFSSKELVGIEESISTFIYNANEESRIQKPFNLVEKLPLIRYVLLKQEHLTVSKKKHFIP
jgi:hypothetical protein